MKICKNVDRRETHVIMSIIFELQIKSITQLVLAEKENFELKKFNKINGGNEYAHVCDAREDAWFYKSSTRDNKRLPRE